MATSRLFLIVDMAGFNPRTGNAGISYIRGKISVRLQVNHRGEYLSSYNTNISRMVYARKRTALDIKTVYYISKQYNVYLDVNNVLSEPDRGTLIGGRPRYRRAPQKRQNRQKQLRRWFLVFLSFLRRAAEG